MKKDLIFAPALLLIGTALFMALVIVLLVTKAAAKKKA